jgi:hypothetical protein
MFGCADPSRVSTKGRRVTGPCSSNCSRAAITLSYSSSIEGVDPRFDESQIDLPLPHHAIISALTDTRLRLGGAWCHRLPRWAAHTCSKATTVAAASKSAS